MEVSSCPGPLVWQRYALGQVEEAEQVALEAHLATCPTCLERLARVPAEDTLVADLRTGLTVASEPPDAVVDQIIRSAAGLGGTQPVAPPTGEALDFLSPPQGSEEIGRLAHFRILRLLGRGGMGLVFLAEDVHLHRRVALKVLSPEFARRPNAAERFLREARAGAALRHDHVVTIYQVGEADSSAGRVPFLAMELLEGASLETTLAQRPLPLAEAVRIGREVAEGLAAAHESGLIHRDVKPDNVWLEERGRVKLLDFGLARAVRIETHLTASGVVVGTPGYLAPEQAAGQQIDGRADLFGLGCVLYRLCTGQVPFQGSDLMAVLTALATQEPIPVRQVNSAVPAALADLIHRLLAKAPADRPASARQVVAQLEGIERQLAEASQPRPPRSRRRFLVLAAALVTLAAVTVLAAAVVLRQSGKPAEFVIETDDPDLVFRADGKGGVLLEDRKTDRRYKLDVGRHDPVTGEYEIDVSEPVGGLEFSTRTLTIKRGERVALEASLRAPEEPKLPDGVTGIDRDWLRIVARLPWAEQVAVVTARLKDLNPGFEGPVTPRIEKGVVVGLEFPSEQITNLAPLRGLPGLRELKCHVTSGPRRGRLADLSPLAGLPLRVLSVAGNDKLSDLRPLAGMPLVELYCSATAVSDLSPLQKCPLEILNVGGTRVRSLEPLKGLPLKWLACLDSAIDDLRPLAGMRLVYLHCGNTQVHDLTPLRKLPLKTLMLNSCPKVKDLTPLKELPLESINLQNVGTVDLTALKDVPLRHALLSDVHVVSNRKLLQAMPTLETINYVPVRQVWADLDAKKPDKKGP